MKCEVVVQCDTRGPDGVSVVAVSLHITNALNRGSNCVSLVQYYDWENNLCHPLSYALDDNVEIEERDIVIPAELDPSQNSIFPDFEPKQIKKMVQLNYVNTH